MPLIKSASPDAISENIRRLTEEGERPHNQIVAIAMQVAKTARALKHKAKGKPRFADRVVAR